MREQQVKSIASDKLKIIVAVSDVTELVDGEIRTKSEEDKSITMKNYKLIYQGASSKLLTETTGTPFSKVFVDVLASKALGRVRIFNFKIKLHNDLI